LEAADAYHNTRGTAPDGRRGGLRRRERCDAMRAFETFEHTADIGLLARGRTLVELFANAADGLADLTVDRDGLADAIRVQVSVSAEDREALMVAWLNELLYLLDTQRFVARRTQITALAATSLRAKLFGDTIDPDRHTVRRMIKAATYHRLSLRRADGVWEARVILDL
jgi:SHS2 domain-containing protein